MKQLLQKEYTRREINEKMGIADAQGLDYFKALRVLTFATSCLEQLQRTQLWMGGGQSPLRQKFNQVFWQAVEEFRKERDLFYDELPGFRPIPIWQPPSSPDVGEPEPYVGWSPPVQSPEGEASDLSS